MYSFIYFDFNFKNNFNFFYSIQRKYFTREIRFRNTIWTEKKFSCWCTSLEFPPQIKQKVKRLSSFVKMETQDINAKYSSPNYATMMKRKVYENKEESWLNNTYIVESILVRIRCTGRMRFDFRYKHVEDSCLLCALYCRFIFVAVHIVLNGIVIFRHFN